MKPCFRILVTGKTGVGKSSFCNYLVGQKVFKTGVGAPVTSWEENFQESTIENAHFDLKFVDTVGIEPDNFQEWSKKIIKYADKEREAQSSNDWVHGIFHVVNASGARYEGIDDQTIELLQQRFPASPLQVILTHADIADQNQLVEIESRLKALNVPVHRVSSVSKRIRKGTVEPKGKDKVVREFYELTSGSIFVRYKFVQLKSIRRQVKTQFKKMKEAARAERNKFVEALFASEKKKRLQSIAAAMQFEVTFDEEQEHAYLSFIELLDPEFSEQLKKSSVRERFAVSKLVDRIESEVTISIDQIQEALAAEMPSSARFPWDRVMRGGFVIRYLKLLGEKDVGLILERAEETVLVVIDHFEHELLSLDKKSIYDDERLRLAEKLAESKVQSKIQAPGLNLELARHT